MEALYSPKMPIYFYKASDYSVPKDITMDVQLTKMIHSKDST
jgi:hypothetical protein